MSDFYYYGMTNAVPRSFDPNETAIAPYFPAPTKQQYDDATLMRYFVRQTNHTTGEIIEISKTSYDRLRTNPFYIAIEMPWRIAGAVEDVVGPPTNNAPARVYTGVRTANRLALEMADEALPGMRNQITNLLQFYKPV